MSKQEKQTNGSFAYFSPNNKINGGALFTSFNSKTGDIYIKLLRQVANNSDKKNNFDGQNPINLKLTLDEAGDFIQAVRNQSDCSLYHTSESGTTTATFKYYRIEPKTDKDKLRQGFGLTVNRVFNNIEKQVKIGFTLGSAERFSLFLQNALMRTFDAEYASQKRAFEDRTKKQKNEPKQDDGPTEVVEESAVDDGDPFGL